MSHDLYFRNVSPSMVESLYERIMKFVEGTNFSMKRVYENDPIARYFLGMAIEHVATEMGLGFVLWGIHTK